MAGTNYTHATSAIECAEYAFDAEHPLLAAIAPMLFSAACALTLPVAEARTPRMLLATVLVGICSSNLFTATDDDAIMRMVFVLWASSAPFGLVTMAYGAQGSRASRFATGLSVMHSVMSGMLVFGLLVGRRSVYVQTSITALLADDWDRDALHWSSFASLMSHGVSAGLAAQCASAARTSRAASMIVMGGWTLCWLTAATWMAGHNDVCATGKARPVFANTTDGFLCYHTHVYAACSGGALLDTCDFGTASALIPVAFAGAVGLARPARDYALGCGRTLSRAIRAAGALCVIAPLYAYAAWSMSYPGSTADARSGMPCNAWQSWVSLSYAYAALGAVGTAIAFYSVGGTAADRDAAVSTASAACTDAAAVGGGAAGLPYVKGSYLHACT